MQNRQKLMHINQENGLKRHFGPFFARIGLFLAQIIFSRKSGFVTFLDSYKADFFYRKCMNKGKYSGQNHPWGENYAFGKKLGSREEINSPGSQRSE